MGETPTFKRMILDDLRVIHQVKAGCDFPVPIQLPDSFLVETCLRRVWVTTKDTLQSSGAARKFQNTENLENFIGVDAYRFLMKFSCGLKGIIPGETQVFGQIKEAWKHFQAQRPPSYKELNPWIQKLFQDTKEIRHRHLQGNGGASYGSLVRKILKPGSHSPILVVGAGPLARSIVPYLRSAELWLWNRAKDSLEKFFCDLTSKPGGIVRIISPEEEEKAWRECVHCIICIPLDPEKDPQRILCWNSGRGSRPAEGKILHLGVFRAHSKYWKEVKEFQSLDDLLELQKTQDRSRNGQLQSAYNSCQEKADFRSIEESLAFSHGWEEVEEFA